MKTKRFLAGVMSLALMGTLAGCGNSEVQAPTDVSVTTASNAGGDTADAGNTDDGGDSAGTGDSEGSETTAAAEERDLKAEFAELYGDEPITLNVFSTLANYNGIQAGWFGEVMKREFNVELNIIPNTDGMLDTRMESGNLGDIVIIGAGGDYDRAVKEGMLYDWNDDDLLDNYGGYIKANMAQALENNANLSETADGNHVVRGFGHNVASSIEEHEAFIYTMDVRWDLYKQLEYPSVKNIDEFFDLMVKMKEICPTDELGGETYAVSLWPDWDGDMVMYIKSFATCYWGYEGDMGLGHYNPDNGEYYYALDEGSPYLQSLKFFNKLYQAGLIDPDSMTQTYAEMSEKVKVGGTFFSIFDYAGSQLYNSEEHLNEGKAMYPLMPDDATPICAGMNVLGGNRIWAIGANTEYPELCMAIINYLSTPEGYLTYWYGPKDVCWYYDDEGNTCFTELGETAYKDRKGTMMPDEWGGASFNEGTFQANNNTWSRDARNPESTNDTYNCENWVSRRASLNYDILNDWREFSNAYNTQEYMNSRDYKVLLGTSFSIASQSDELKVIWKQVTKQVTTSSWQAIYAKTDEEYDKIVADMIQKCNEYDPNGECKAYSLGEAEKRKALDDAVRNG